MPGHQKGQNALEAEKAKCEGEMHPLVREHTPCTLFFFNFFFFFLPIFRARLNNQKAAPRFGFSSLLHRVTPVTPS